jgi:hypothetical protein
MLKHHLITACLLVLSFIGFSQTTRDTLPANSDESLEMDTSFNIDDLLNEMDLFLDSLLKPRSYFLASVSVGSNYFNYVKRNPLRLESEKKRVYSPVAGYFHKSGPGLTLSGNITNTGDHLELYQYLVSPSFDFIQNSNWIGGLSYTRYFTKDSLPFYTSPLQNEYNGYFIWRKSWLQPGITVTYGHGSRSDFKKRERFIEYLRRRRLGSIIDVIKTDEEVADFSVTTSVRHSFYWMNVFGKKDYIKIVPQIAFAAGTQKFGFNRTTSTYSVNLRNATNLLYNTGDVNVDQDLEFQPLSLSLYLRPEYSIGKFFIQPQFILDYYFPSENFTTVFALNAGVVF